MRLEWPGFQLGMKLHADKPGMIFVFDNLGQDAIGRHSGETHAALFESSFVRGIDFIAMTMTLGNLRRSVNLRHAAPAREDCLIRAKAHRAAKVAARTALL